MITRFCTGLILGSASEVHCENHVSFEENCDQCISLKEDVVKFQSHRHKFTCHKKKRKIVITEDQGHGRHDGKKKGVPLELKVCRFNFPRNPMDKTQFIRGFSKDMDQKFVNKARVDYEKIRKFLLRLTSVPDYENTKEWAFFINLSFYEFLFEVGMFDTINWRSDAEAQQRARDRYLTALRLIVNI